VAAEAVPPGLEAALERIASVARPIGPLRHVDTGFFSLVYETGSNWIIRVARTEAAAERHLREARFLPWIARQIDVAVPGPCIVLPPREGMVFGGVAYPRLPGAIVSPGQHPWDGLLFAREMASFLAGLHSLDVNAAGEHGLSFPPPRAEQFASLRSSCEAALLTRVSAAEWHAVHRWWDAFLADERMDRFQPVVVHGDTWWGNVLQERGRVTAVLDWEHARIDDPAHDLCGQGHAGREFMQDVIRRYCAMTGEDESTLTHRARSYAAMREFYGIQWSAQMDDEEEMADSIRKLRAGPILAGIR
jgi:aminoglycoside phosphotransferase (APT) family kinase protein